MAQLKKSTVIQLTLGGVDVEAKLTELETKMNNITDYIVSQGSVTCSNNSSITWYYKKYNSGVSECWGYYDITPTETGWAAWGSLYEFGPFGSFNYPSNLFSDYPIFTQSIYGSQGICGIECDTHGTATDTPRMYLLRPNTGYAAPVRVGMRAIGRWK